MPITSNPSNASLLRGKYVYYFGNGRADGTGAMRALLGGKGANLAEVCTGQRKH
jgi:pyruvate,orthophosphate dikinase